MYFPPVRVLTLWTNAMVQLWILYYFLATGISIIEGKVCVKRAEIGTREGNLYNCEDPVLTECCERNRTFTCCEPAWKNTMRDQLWLLFAVVVIGFLICILFSWCTGQSEFFRSPTAKDAVINWRSKVAHTFDFIRGNKSGAQGSSFVGKPPYASLDSTGQSASFKTQAA